MSTNYRRPVDAASLGHNFRVFADADCAHEPLYFALSRAIAGDDDTLALLMQAPYPQRRPVLLFASVHDLLLAGQAHPLGRFYRSVSGPEFDPDVESAPAAFFDFCRVHRDALARLLVERSTQTNEIGRGAGLRLALATLGEPPIALVDVGCSAGLNLLVDRYRFRMTLPGGQMVAGGPDGPVVVPVSIVSGRPDPARPIPSIRQRIGIDREPLDVRSDRDARWLGACVWPSDVARHQRLAAAISLARRAALDLRRGDAVATLAGVLDEIAADVRPVVFHSWVVSYFEHDARRRFVDAVRAMVDERDGAWISAEGPNVVPGLAPPPLPADAGVAREETTVWHVTTRAGVVAIARSHPHCRWIEWLA